jgi:hypothetical protein
MMKIILVAATTAVPAFAAGIWAQATLTDGHHAETRGIYTPSTISPFEMQRNVKPDDLSIQYMQGDFN